MTVAVADALTQIKAELGEGLPPARIPKVAEILQQFRQAVYDEGHQDGYEYGFEQAQYSVGDWNRP